MFTDTSLFNKSQKCICAGGYILIWCENVIVGPIFTVGRSHRHIHCTCIMYIVHTSICCTHRHIHCIYNHVLHITIDMYIVYTYICCTHKHIHLYTFMDRADFRTTYFKLFQSVSFPLHNEGMAYYRLLHTDVTYT